MSVVLPAPLPPIRPKTTPWGTISERSASAVLRSKVRVTLCNSMMELLATMVSYLVSSRVQGGMTLLNDLDEVVDRNVHLTGFGEQGIDAFVENHEAFAA